MTLTPEQLEAQQKQLDAQQKQLMEPWEPDMGEEERRQKMDSMLARQHQPDICQAFCFSQ